MGACCTSGSSIPTRSSSCSRLQAMSKTTLIEGIIEGRPEGQVSSGVALQISAGLRSVVAVAVDVSDFQRTGFQPTRACCSQALKALPISSRGLLKTKYTKNHYVVHKRDALGWLSTRQPRCLQYAGCTSNYESLAFQVTFSLTVYKLTNGTTIQYSTVQYMSVVFFAADGR